MPDITVTTQACPRFVEFVEDGVTSGPELEQVARSYLASIQAAGCDTLILGCTHYPLLAGLVSYILGDEVTLISSSEECARACYARARQEQILHSRPREANRYFLTTGNAERFERLGRRLMSGFVHDVRNVGVESVLGDHTVVRREG